MAADPIDADVTTEVAPPEAPSRLPAVVPPLPAPAARPRRRWRLAAVLVLIMAGAGGAFWWLQATPPLPLGFAAGNGRLEADEIDIDTKYAGRIAELAVDEGDLVTGGQVLARMDSRDLETSRGKAQAQVRQSQRFLDEAKDNLAQQQSRVVLAKQELDRTAALVPKGYATVELLDQRRQQMNASIAAERAASARVAGAEHALEAAAHDVELYTVQIADHTLVAPRAGRIEYRVANVGEVLGAGGKVFTMLDTGYVYMDIYLPTQTAGRVRLGSDARITLDAYPGHAIPAKVVYIASQAQFTPKTVETADERDKLMFRIRVRIDPERLRGRADIVRSGLPGVAYVRTDPDAQWPAALAADAPR